MSKSPSVGQDRLILPCLRSGDRKLQSIARRPAKNAKVRKDLNILRAVPVLLIKVLTDLKKLRAAFFYRHLGPHGPKEGMPLHPEPLRLTPFLSCPSCSSCPSCFRQQKNAPLSNRWRVSLVRRNSRKGIPFFRSGRPACL